MKKRVVSSASLQGVAVLVLLVSCSRKEPRDARDAAQPADAGRTETRTESGEPSPSSNPAESASSSPGGPCGSATCRPGWYCCNESCGICAPVGGFCTQQYCAPSGKLRDGDDDGGAGWPRDAGEPLDAGRGGQRRSARCKVDADCQTHSSYCAESPCFCLPVGAGDAAPKCTKASVSCLVDPCARKVARCEAGACVVVDSSTPGR